MPRPLQRGLQERGAEGPSGSRGPQDGGEGSKWVRKVNSADNVCH